MAKSLDHVSHIQEQWARERPDVDTAPQGVIGRLHRVGLRLTEQLVTVYAQFGLTEGEFDVLATLRRSGPPYELTPGELAGQTMVTTGGMTKRLDRLERAGLLDKAFTAHMENEARLLEQLTPAQVRQLETLLATWLDRLEP